MQGNKVLIIWLILFQKMLHKAKVGRIEGKETSVNVTHLVIIKSLLPTQFTNMDSYAIKMIKASKYKTKIRLTLMLNALLKPMKLSLKFNDLQDKQQNLLLMSNGLLQAKVRVTYITKEQFSTMSIPFHKEEKKNRNQLSANCCNSIRKNSIFRIRTRTSSFKDRSKESITYRTASVPAVAICSMRVSSHILIENSWEI
jgi:hypothetical protein